jgi:hypothetical protein
MGGWRHTGDKQEISADRQERLQARFDARVEEATAAHRHLWVATVPFFVTVPLDEGAVLDAENMAMPPMVGCYICERALPEIYDPAGRCSGEPR